MHLLFLDESGAPSDRTFALGGASVRAADWEGLRIGWEEALRDHSWPVGRELKWHGIRTGEVPPALADAVFALLAGAPVRCSVCLLRPIAGRKEHPQFFVDEQETYATGLRFLAERFQRYLAREDSHGVIVLDSRRPDADDRMRRLFDQLQREGTEYVELDRIVDTLMFSPSHFSLGLQVADLVVACTRAALTTEQGDARRWHRELLPRFARHPDTGEVDGVGLVRFPRKVGAEEPGGRKLFRA